MGPDHTNSGKMMVRGSVLSGYGKWSPGRRIRELVSDSSDLVGNCRRLDTWYEALYCAQNGIADIADRTTYNIVGVCPNYSSCCNHAQKRILLSTRVAIGTNDCYKWYIYIQTTYIGKKLIYNTTTYYTQQNISQIVPYELYDILNDQP